MGAAGLHGAANAVAFRCKHRTRHLARHIIASNFRPVTAVVEIFIMLAMITREMILGFEFASDIHTINGL